LESFDSTRTSREENKHASHTAKHHLYGMGCSSLERNLGDHESIFVHSQIGATNAHSPALAKLEVSRPEYAPVMREMELNSRNSEL
jgi:hypothetical protein